VKTCNEMDPGFSRLLYFFYIYFFNGQLKEWGALSIQCGYWPDEPLLMVGGACPFLNLMLQSRHPSGVADGISNIKMQILRSISTKKNKFISVI
jgi:hypothetical protein